MGCKIVDTITCSIKNQFLWLTHLRWKNSRSPSHQSVDNWNQEINLCKAQSLWCKMRHVQCRVRGMIIIFSKYPSSCHNTNLTKGSKRLLNPLICFFCTSIAMVIAVLLCCCVAVLLCYFVNASVLIRWCCRCTFCQKSISDFINNSRLIEHYTDSFVKGLELSLHLSVVFSCIIVGPVNSNFTPRCYGLQAFLSANCLQHYPTSGTLGTWQYSLNLWTYQPIQSACPSSLTSLSGHQQPAPTISILHSFSCYGADIHVETFSYCYTATLPVSVDMLLSCLSNWTGVICLTIAHNIIYEAFPGLFGCILATLAKELMILCRLSI